MRQWAVQRYVDGENPASICLSLGRSKAWLYKWLDRYDPTQPDWFASRSTQPRTTPKRTSREVEDIVKLTRLNLYNKGLFCGAQSILWELEAADVHPLPALRTINRILSRHALTHRRTGRYEVKGTPYPSFLTQVPNQRHQADFVGPRHLRNPSGALRFYGVNVVDLATGRCGTEPVFNRSADAVYAAFWAIWNRLGIPRHLQVDNELVFYGSPTHPRGMGPLIRLCLHHSVELWFIPPSEPWRNGVVEQFNHHYQQKFLDRVIMTSIEELRERSLAFEHLHNSRYRYSKLNGKTPLKVLAEAGSQGLRYPPDEIAPKVPLDKPQWGRYHLIRLIRSDCRLNVFGEGFAVAPDLQYEYVVATIDVKEQKLKLFLRDLQVEEFDYKLR